MAASIDNASPALLRCWHPVGRLDDLGELQRVEVCGRAFVVVRGADGGFRAFADACPHRLGRLSDGRVVDGELECPYHGWRFDQGGACTLIPALGPEGKVPPKAALRGVAVAERYGLLWLVPEGEAVAPLAEIAEWDEPGLRPVWLPAVDIAAGAAQFIDNFLDFAHFPFVHAGTFGDTESPRIGEYAVERGDHGLVVDYEHTIVNNEDPLVAGGEHPLVQPRRMRYAYTVPFTAVLRLELPLTGTVNAIASFCQPVDATTTRLYTAMLRNDCAPGSDAANEAVDYELAVLAEDLRILERLPDTSLALDANAALHTRADRLTVEFRRLLRELADRGAVGDRAR